MNDVELTKRLDRELALGISRGFNDAGNFILDKASDLFRDGKDSEAIKLRILGKELIETGIKKYPGNEDE